MDGERLLSPDEQAKANWRSWAAVADTHEAAKRDVVSALVDGVRFVPEEVGCALDELPWSKVLQPLCNDGRELLDLLNRRPTASGLGVDFVERFVKTAAQNALRLGTSARFECAEVGAWLREPRDFSPDLIYSSIGSLWWIADLDAFLAGLHDISVQRGYLLVWEFHPMLHALSDNLAFSADYPFRHQVAAHDGGVRPYISCEETPQLACPEHRVARRRTGGAPVFCHLWGLGELLSSAAGAGWQLRRLDEFPVVQGERFLEGLVDKGNGDFGLPDDRPSLPLSLIALFQKGLPRNA